MSRPTEAEITEAIAKMDGKRSKYNVDTSAAGKEARTFDGIQFDSKREMKTYRDWVKPQINAGLLRNLQFQVKFALNIKTPTGFNIRVGYYVADWTALDRQGRLQILEAKGHRTPLYNWKKKHFEAEYGLRITEL